jgi:toxin ParE1/3/4
VELGRDEGKAEAEAPGEEGIVSPRVQLTARAQADADAIALWIARGGGEEAALNWYDGFDAKLKRLAQTPGSGTDQSHLGQGLRSSPFGNYLVFFKAIPSGVRIVRVVHAARDYRAFFDEP